MLQYYADELGELERELSLSDRYSSSSKELGALADASHNDEKSRVDEPYRRAIFGIRKKVLARLEGRRRQAPMRRRRNSSGTWT